VRVVIDPNVFVSALISPAGPSAQIVRAWADERFDLVVSDALIFELDDVLGRPKFRRWISESDAAEFVAGPAAAGTVVGDPSNPSPVSANPADDYLIAIAQTACADYLVSGDHHLTDLADLSPPVLTPRNFLDLLRRDSVPEDR
jgi:putative PIN family toxin of toxin-antitoxin system